MEGRLRVLVAVAVIVFSVGVCAVGAGEADGKLEITYGKKTLVEGELFEQLEAEKPPVLSFPTKPDEVYGLIMYDPDAPSRKTAKQGMAWLHWLVVNINGTSNISTGNTIVPYAGPTPPKGSGEHRYIIRVFKMSAPMSGPFRTMARKDFPFYKLPQMFSYAGDVAKSHYVVEN